MPEKISQPRENYKKKFDDFLETSKQSLNSIIDSFKNNISQSTIIINETTQKVSKLKIESENASREIIGVKEKIDEFHAELFDGSNGAPSIKEDIEDSQRTITESYNSIIDYEQILFGKEEKLTEITQTEAGRLLEKEKRVKDGKYYRVVEPFCPGLKHRIEMFEEGIEEAKKKIDQEVKEYNNRTRESIDTCGKEFEEFIRKHDEEFNLLKNRVESFLPTALAAGLSSAYRDAKEDHTKAEFRWRFIFCVSIVAMFATACLGFFFFGVIPEGKEMSVSNIFVSLLKLAPFEFPLLWLGWMSGKRIKQEAKFIAEYQHKWAVAFSYDGLRKEVEKIDDSISEEDKREQSVLLLHKFIEAYSDNPSKTINISDEDMPHEKTLKSLMTPIISAAQGIKKPVLPE